MSKKKVIISTIALLLVMFVTVSVVSYSIANLGNSDKLSQDSMTNLGATNTSNYVTNIDLIIEAAISEHESFNIVEIIPSGTTESDLKQYVAGEGFAKYVLSANKSTATSDMPANHITYTPLVITSDVLLTTTCSYEAITADASGAVTKSNVESTVQGVLDRADLIYLSSPAYASYDGNSNLSEDVYNYLHVYASSNKPIIMDYVTQATTVSVNTLGGLVNAISRNYYKFRTFGWDTANVSAMNFFSSNGSYYLKLNANAKATTGNVLVIANSSTAMMDKMKAENESNLIAAAYYGLVEKKPSKLNYTVLNVTNNSLTVDNLTGDYDFILIEDGVKDIQISDEVFAQLRALSESSKYIIFDSKLDTSSQGSISASRNNYLKLLQLLVSDEGIEKQTNVLAISYGFFTSLNSQGANGTDGAKSIADLIDGTTYRDTDTTGKAGKKFRVLEIQPCYPIDTKLAESSSLSLSKFDGIKGGYYTVPDQVMYGVTKEEIPEGTEYYAFEVSKAKIAHATGIPYEQIEVVSMSTNEYISSKDVVAESYDLVYIGGDSSAYVPHLNINYSSTKNIQNQTAALAAFTAFDMYTHTGVFVDYRLPYDKIGAGANSIETSGNDLTTIKRNELEDYVDSGLPIIIDEMVTSAFETSYAFDPDNEDSTNKNRLEQLSLRMIDPDSNMYDFLEYAYKQVKEYEEKKVTEAVTSNIGWGLIDSANTDTPDDDLSNSEISIDNVDRMYGSTLGSTVTVYGCATEINNLVKLSAKRPELSVTSYPIEYVEGDDSTTNIGTTASFTAKVDSSSITTSTGNIASGDASGDANGTTATSETYTVALYVDANGDGTYSESEKIESKTCTAGGTVDLTYPMDKDFFGLVNWKIKATAPNGVLCDMKSGIAFFKAEEGLKKTVRVLQIMPVDGVSATDYTLDGSLYFCTECQQSGKRINYNVTVDLANENGLDMASYNDRSNVTTIGKDVYVGKHIHNFGIVKHDTTIYKDDFEDNFAYSLTHGADGTKETGEFEFELDILSHKEFDELCAEAKERDEDTIAVANIQLYGDDAGTDPGLVADYETAVKNLSTSAEKKNLEEALVKAAMELIGTDVRYRDVVIKGILGEDPDSVTIDSTTGKVSFPEDYQLGKWILDEEYYKFWSYINDWVYGSTNSRVDNAVFTDAITAYDAYIKLRDVVVDKYDQMRTVAHQDGDEETWLNNNYDVIVLGLADQFANADLSAESCEQIKSYVKNGGSVLNSHDSLNAKASAGNGPNTLTTSLRETFGMDRFHVRGIQDDSTEVTIKSPLHTTKKIEIGFSWGEVKGSFVIDRKDYAIVLDDNNNIISATEVGEEKAIGTPITITVTGGNQWNPPHYREEGSSIWTATGGSFTVNQGESYVTSSFGVGANNMTGTFDLATGVVNVQTTDIVAGVDGLKLDISVTDNGVAVPDGTKVVFTFRGSDTTVTTQSGVATTYVKLDSLGSATSVPADGTIYRHYVTKDASKYFWTQRLKATDTSQYTSLINSTGGMIDYNVPIGLSDLYAVYNNIGVANGMYKYVMTEPEAFDHSGTESDGANYQIHYGTRKAQQVNKGGVTLYPFAISEELLISPTHAQTFALDLEDPSVAVWYTLAGTYVNSDSTNGLTVSAQSARYNSAFYAASPRDGMSNYFLYSKDGVFYTGAGHMRVTGNLKDNNDERRLFINVIVNCVTKGKVGPDLRLYNECTKSDCKDDKCDCYVDPEDDETNKKLAKELNTLYYNSKEEVYQYNVDESEDRIYPEFDFKAIAGTYDIKKVDVFYDLDYDKDDVEASDAYVADDDHVLISTYTKDVDGTRYEIRKPDPEPKDDKDNPLLLKDEYFANYNNFTYIVVRVQDTKGQTNVARIKINVIPYLFDLTDATSDTWGDRFAYPTLDMTDKKQFNI